PHHRHALCRTAGSHLPGRRHLHRTRIVRPGRPRMKPRDIHDEWLSLIEVSGPFLATPVLERVFSTGLPAVEQRIRQYLRQAHGERGQARDHADPRVADPHRAWVHEVLARGREYAEGDSGDLQRRRERLPDPARLPLPEYGVTLVPDSA